MRCVCGHYRTEFFMTHPFLCYCFSGDTSGDVDPMFAECYDALGYDFSFRGLG